jgi:hypothetical protein
MDLLKSSYISTDLFRFHHYKNNLKISLMSLYKILSLLILLTLVFTQTDADRVIAPPVHPSLINRECPMSRPYTQAI